MGVVKEGLSVMNCPNGITLQCRVYYGFICSLALDNSHRAHELSKSRIRNLEKTRLGSGTRGSPFPSLELLLGFSEPFGVTNVGLRSQQPLDIGLTVLYAVPRVRSFRVLPFCFRRLDCVCRLSRPSSG